MTKILRKRYGKGWRQKNISLKSLHVLVIDGTDTQMELPFEEPLRIYSENSLDIDSLVESRYYNRLVLEAFEENLPLRAKICVLTEKLSAKTLDSLMALNKFDLLITARQIRFNYEFKHSGIHETVKYRNGGDGLMGPNDAGHINSASVLRKTLPFDFSGKPKMTPRLLRTIIYHTHWDLQWINPALDKKVTAPRQLVQQNSVTDPQQQLILQNSAMYMVPGDVESLFIDAARQAGKNLAQVFRW